MSEHAAGPDVMLALARSRFLDAFALAEEAVAARLRHMHLPVHAMLAQNIQALKKCPANPRYSKDCKAKVDQALGSLGVIQPIRCDVVHGPLQLVISEGETVACFANPQRSNEWALQASLISVQQFRELTAQLHKVARNIAAD